MICAIVVLAIAATPLDVPQADGTVYRKFDRELMARITAENRAKLAENRRYDQVTFLPVEPERKSAVKSARDEMVEQERRQARMRMVAMRKQRRQQASMSGGYDPLWWIFTPAIPTKPCPWAAMSWSAYLSRH